MSVKNPSTFAILVSEEQAGLRLDKLLASADFISSRSRASELIERGLVTSGGRPLKASYKPKVNEEIRIELPAPVNSALEPLDRPLDILFEDDDIVVVNKPAGLVVHPAAGHAQDTLVNILLHHVENLSMGFGEHRPGIVHRLDRDTSGILVVAKNDHAHQALAEQFREKTAHRIYWAIVYGVPPVQEKTIRSNLARHPQDRKRYSSTPSGQGKLAVTHYKVLQSLPNKMSWLECKLETGRTHQIRVHLSESGFPIVGDNVYGAKSRLKHVGIQYQTVIENLNRVALHACELGFIHPTTKTEMHFQVPWPLELLHLTHVLGFKNA